MFALARLTVGPPGISFVGTCRGVNSPSACRCVMRNPRLQWHLHVSSKAPNMLLTFLLVKWFATVKRVFLLSARKNGVLLTKNMSAVMNTS